MEEVKYKTQGDLIRKKKKRRNQGEKDELHLE